LRLYSKRSVTSLQSERGISNITYRITCPPLRD
jgi:hypothetical protein